MSGDDAAGVPQSQKGTWLSFLKQVSTFSGDLSSLTAPSFILSPTSLLEFTGYWGEPAEEFAAISTGKTSEERMLLVLKWFIMTLKGSYTRRETQTGSEKKPLNPILGELFYGSWPAKAERGETKLHAEQVSHHPPIQAYYLENQKARVSLQGHCAQKTSFSARSISVKQVGHAIIRVTLEDGNIESYLITLPKLRIEGLWYGSPYVELTDSSHIQSSAGHHAQIDYKGKGYLSGKSHTFHAKVSERHGSNPLYTIDGQWNEISKYSAPSKKYQGEVFADARGEKEEISVKPIEEQGELESRRVWQKVAEGIRTGNFDAASAAKSKLENDQRQKRKDEAASGKPWEMQLFTRVDEDDTYTDLAAKFNHAPATEDGYLFKHS